MTHFSCTHHKIDTQFLLITPRKRGLKHKLVFPISGEVLVRLGAQEWVIRAGDLFWVPAGCLVSLTYMPNCSVFELTLSQRVAYSFPTNAGFIKPSELLSSMVNRLISTPFIPPQPAQDAVHQQIQEEASHQQYHLYALLQMELAQLMACTKSAPTTQGQLNLDTWIAQLKCASQVSVRQEIAPKAKEVTLALAIREADKSRASGGAKKVAMEKLGLSESLFDEVYRAVIGKAW